MLRINLLSCLRRVINTGTLTKGGAGMQVKKIENGLPIHEPAPRMTEEQLYNEINYYRASKLTKKMLDAGLITEDEYKRIMKMNRDVFKPFLYQLMPDD